MPVRWRSPLSNLVASACLGAALAPFASSPLGSDPPRPAAGNSLAVKKDPLANADDVAQAAKVETLGSLVSLHTGEILVLSPDEPSLQEFSWLLRDRVTNDKASMAAPLLALVRQLGDADQPVRMEVVSGYRSWKLNEMLRKKGRRVASQSQHSLGHAVDFRVEGWGPKQLASAIEKLKWKGGLAYYPADTDGFVHADVGPNRRWRGL